MEGSRRAYRPPFAVRTIDSEGLTDGWNYVKVVVGSNLCMEIHIKRRHAVWMKYRQAGEVVDLQGLFNSYWTSNKHKLTVPSES